MDFNTPADPEQRAERIDEAIASSSEKSYSLRLRYIIALAAIAVVAVSCEHSHTPEEMWEIRQEEYDAGNAEGFLQGYDQGYDQGYWKGVDDGYQQAYDEVERRSGDFHQFLWDWYGPDWGADGCREVFGDWCNS